MEAPKIRREVRMIVIGLTGAGKSSLINLYYFLAQGGKVAKDLQSTLIPTKYFAGLKGDSTEKGLRSDQAHS